MGRRKKMKNALTYKVSYIGPIVSYQVRPFLSNFLIFYSCFRDVFLFGIFLFYFPNILMMISVPEILPSFCRNKNCDITPPYFGATFMNGQNLENIFFKTLGWLRQFFQIFHIYLFFAHLYSSRSHWLYLHIYMYDPLTLQKQIFATNI